MQEEERTYFVIDMKTFYASVECAERGLNPFTTNLIVADQSRGGGSVCLAVTPHLKELGVKNRCRFYEVPKNLKFIIAKPRMKKYIEYASEIYGIYLKYIDKSDIHVYSIDECFLDVTDYLKIYKISAKNFALKLVREIDKRLHIPATTGIGTNLFLAKVALDILAKKSEDGLAYLDEQTFQNELWHHTPITDFWGISTGIEKRLQKYGIEDMWGVAHIDSKFLYKEFGINAELIIDHAWGRESCLMCDIKKYQPKTKSLSHSQVLPKNYNLTDAYIVLQEMVINGCYELFSSHYVTNSIYVYIGYGDRLGENSKGSVNMPNITNLYFCIEEYLHKLFYKIADKSRPIRKIGFAFGNIVSDKNERYDLLADLDRVQKEKRIIASVLDVQNKFGKNAILKGLSFYPNSTQRERNKMIGGHNSE